MKNWYFLSGFLFTFLLFHACSIDPMGEASTIEGRVVNSSGVGLEGVDISCITLYDTVILATDNAGYYELKFNGGGIARMNFSKNEYFPQISMFQTSGIRAFPEIILRLESEEAFLTLPKLDFSVKNTSGYLTISVKTNIDYTIECNESWLSPSKTPTGVTVYYVYNPQMISRTGYIYLEGEYNRRATIKIYQSASSAAPPADPSAMKPLTSGIIASY